MSAVTGPRIRKVDQLQKRIPENPKYKNVQTRVDTGASLNKYMRKIEEIRTNYKFRKNEIFKRMKVTTFAQLVIQVQRVSLLPDEIPATPGGEYYSNYGDRPETADEEIMRLSRGDGNTSPVPSLVVTEGDYGRQSDMDTHRSTLLSVAGGIGELDMNQPSPATPGNGFVDNSCPYLLLDVRDPDEYEACHIISALSYPKSMLSRATNYESKEMLKYRNMVGKIIVIYDEDERLAPLVSQTLVERGYDNIFMLSGGLKVTWQMIPEGLMTGTIPSSITGKKTKPIVPASQKEFCTEDIDSMEIYLDNALQDTSVGSSSRLSKASTVSTRMSKAGSVRSVSSRSSTSTIQDRPPFKPV